MTSADKPSGEYGSFSPELTRDVASALRAYLLSFGAEGDAELQQLTKRVCKEAHALGLPPEKMLIAIKRLFEQAPFPDLRRSERRLRAFEKFISGCIRNSPTGTARNKNISGKNRVRTTCTPSTAHTAAINIAIKAYCAPILTLPASASSQAPPASASNIRPRQSE